MVCILPGIPVFGAAEPKENNSGIDDLIAAAEQGDPEAQYELGSAYDSGIGVSANLNLAEKGYISAAKSGHAESQNSLDSDYQAEGKYAEAVRLYSLASKQNHALAINNLA